MTSPENPFDFQVNGDATAVQPNHVPKTIYSVSELTSKIKAFLEDSFPLVWICGEVSNFRMPASGHCYFILKDESAQISAVVFRGHQRQARFTPEDGMSIIGLGRLSVYEPRGAYQIILEYIEPAGLGALQLAFEKLKKRLSEKGYFDPQRKRPLPYLPSKVSVITSPSGAVVHDIITIFNRRFRNLHIEIVAVKVQGTGAESEIRDALALVNECADSDVIILARGGGSLEDLQAFNSETVATAIFQSKIPVVSAVGHETDVTIADFVADLRAPTPSAAAELVVPEKNELLRRSQELRKALYVSFLDHLKELNKNFEDLRRRLTDPRRKIQELWLWVDDLTGRLARSFKVRLHHEKDRLTWFAHRLNGASPRIQLEKNNSMLEVIQDKLFKLITIFIKTKRSDAREYAVKLEALNPLAILQRGYSVTRSLPEKRVLTNPGQVSLSQDVEVLLAGGLLVCNVKEKSTYGEENL
jgi:exodeoxyribonuclease VII large subunit